MESGELQPTMCGNLSRELQKKSYNFKFGDACSQYSGTPIPLKEGINLLEKSVLPKLVSE